MPNLEIVFTTRGVNTLLSSLTKISKQFDALDKKAGQFKGFSAGAGTLTAAAKSLDRSASGLNKAASNIKTAATLLNKSTGGKPLVHATGGAGGPAGNNQAWSKLVKSLTVSRVGSTGNGGGAGSIAKMGQFAPLLAELGPIGAAAAGIAGIVGAGSAIESLGRKAAELGQAFSSLRFTLGSGPGTTAQLSSVGTAIGLSSSDIGSIAASIQSKISSDPYARAFGLRMGIMNISGPFGNPDWGKQLQSVIEGLRKIPNWTQRIIAARTLGAEGLLPITQLSQHQYGKIAEDSKFREQIFTPQQGMMSADFMASIGRIGQAFENLTAALGSGTLTRLTEWANQFADWLNRLSGIVSNYSNLFRGILDMIDG